MTPHEQALADASSSVVSCGFNPATSDAITNIVIRAYLRARREIDGAVLCRVPGEVRHLFGNDRAKGHAEGVPTFRVVALASAEAPDADV